MSSSSSGMIAAEIAAGAFELNFILHDLEACRRRLTSELKNTDQ
jgi:hypothetical protein